jgi:hypothetical protein
MVVMVVVALALATHNWGDIKIKKIKKRFSNFGSFHWLAESDAFYFCLG